MILAPPARLMVKLSGESLLAENGSWLNTQMLDRLSDDLMHVQSLGYQLSIVIGGGNIIRGVQISEQDHVERTVADQLGMLATVMNAMAIESSLRKKGGKANTLSAISMPTLCDTYIRRNALKMLDDGYIVILAGGIGNPLFTTDTAAVLRAVELRCDSVLKATKVDGVYSSDPHSDRRAKRYETLSHDDALRLDLKIMDVSAFSLARDNKMPILIGSIYEPSSIGAILEGSAPSTRVLP